MKTGTIVAIGAVAVAGIGACFYFRHKAKTKTRAVKTGAEQGLLSGFVTSLEQYVPGLGPSLGGFLGTSETSDSSVVSDVGDLTGVGEVSDF